MPPQHLEHSLEELDLTSFGLMDTTLEEVFLKVSEEDQSLENSDVGTGRGVTRCCWGWRGAVCLCLGLVAPLPLPMAAGASSPKGRRGLQRSPAKGSGLCSTLGLQSRSVPALCHVAMKVVWLVTTPLLPDMKESKKDAPQSPAPELGPKPEANGEPLAEAAVPEKPEVELSNLVTCSKLAQSQASLRSASSVGSVRGDEGGAYSEFFGDYAPLFDNRQDPDNISLQGSCQRQGPGEAFGWDVEGGRGSGRASAHPCSGLCQNGAVPACGDASTNAAPGEPQPGWGPGNGCFYQVCTPNWQHVCGEAPAATRSQRGQRR